MTNEQHGGELSIQKCDSCKDGYLIVKKGRDYFLGCTNYKPDKSGCSRQMSLENYHIWRSDDFGTEDLSKDKPAYLNISPFATEMPEIPEMISAKETTTPSVAEKKPQVHTVDYSERMIEKDGFRVLTDTQGNLLTDIALLTKLRILRKKLAEEYQYPAYYVISNDTLALLATDKPTTREEFIAIKGIGERKYARFGEQFIAEIKKHIES